MHIPDGFLSPETYTTFYAINIPLWLYTFKKKIQKLNLKEFPQLAILAGFTFIITTVQFPIVGGTTIHLLGIVLLTLISGLWNTYLVYSIVFLLQFLLLGIGGITGYPLLVFSNGFLAPLIVLILNKIFKKTIKSEKNLYFYFSIIAMNFISITISTIFVGFILGIQPLIAIDEQNKPLYFPYIYKVSIPAMFIGHIPVMIIESLITIIVISLYDKYKQYLK